MGDSDKPPADTPRVRCVSHDPELLDKATDFVADVIGFSEPLSSTHADPEPDMLYKKLDHAAMWEASRQQ